ncbi:hypothetical protein ACQUW5_00705 [Legionella sp. CNM-1927-20]|uniref:hypothetical protein n=1 Tax=Legionella sp. CNM-1927-20 TaxID=3422221 RepID=UPI00403B374D
MQTALFKQKLVERLAQIESVMNELKNYHGLAKANTEAFITSKYKLIWRLLLSMLNGWLFSSGISI